MQTTESDKGIYETTDNTVTKLNKVTQDPPKLPEDLKQAIHAVACDIEKKADELCERTEEVYYKTEAYEYLAGFGASVLNYFAIKMDKLGNASGAAICALFSTTMENQRQEAEQAAQVELEIEETSAKVEIIAQRIADATASNNTEVPAEVETNAKISTRNKRKNVPSPVS